MTRPLDRLRRFFQSESPEDDVKGSAELAFWRERVEVEGTLTGPHFAGIFTTDFGLSPEFYAGKRMLDIGCGPRGTLEWATDAARRVGLDPLADDYRELGIDAHAMEYVPSGAENMPFDDASFDVVSSLNSLDHVDDLDQTVAEIKRVLAPGGTFLLVTEVGHEPTSTEPLTFDFDVVDLFAPELAVLEKWEFEMVHELVHASALSATPYDHSDPTRRSGILRARMSRHP